MSIMTRQALFEAAWERPLTDIAADLGITSTGLKKICDRYDIPTPGRGYWAQVRAGRTFPRPRLRPANLPAMEQVAIQGARPLPAAVKAIVQQAQAERAARPRSGAKPKGPHPPDGLPDAISTGEQNQGLAPARKELQATLRAITSAKVDSDGFVAVQGRGIVPLRVSSKAAPTALSFLEALLALAESSGWRLEATAEKTSLLVDGEAVAFRLEEQPTKTPHRPTAQELAQKKERDRLGGDSRPWRTWDLSPSGRLALVIEENDYSGLRRTFSERKGFPFEASLDVILAGFAAHAALKIERRREREAQARAAAEAEARRRRLEAFGRREKHRAELVDAIAAALEERARHVAVLSHLEGATADPAAKLDPLMSWLRRRIRALDDLLDPRALEISARTADVGFEEPPPGSQNEYWYARKVELLHWIPAEEEGRVRGVGELEWAVAEGLIPDPAAPLEEGAPWE
jgi:hypothetical protein